MIKSGSSGVWAWWPLAAPPAEREAPGVSAFFPTYDLQTEQLAVVGWPDATVALRGPVDPAPRPGQVVKAPDNPTTPQEDSLAEYLATTLQCGVGQRAPMNQQ